MKFSITIEGKGRDGVYALLSFDVEAEWLACDVKDVGKMATFVADRAMVETIAHGNTITRYGFGGGMVARIVTPGKAIAPGRSDDEKA